MFYAIYNSKGELLSTASEIDEKVLEEKKLSYKIIDGEEGDFNENKNWDKASQDFVDKPDPIVIGKTKEEKLVEIETELGLTKEQLAKLEEYL